MAAQTARSTTHTTRPAAHRTPATVKAELARAERQRRQRLQAEEQDHFERTRQSFIYAGIELGQVKPTAATERKLRPDPISRMHASGNLSAERVRAAIEIRKVYETIVGGMLARTILTERIGMGRRSVISEHIATLHADHYLPWARYLGGSETDAGKCPVALELAIDVIVDGKSLDDCEQERCWRSKGIAGQILRYALAVYADMAGWERCRAEIAVFEERLPRRGGWVHTLQRDDGQARVPTS